MKENEGKTEIINLLLHSKPVGILLSLKGSEGKYASIISKEIDCTYTHTLKILNDFRKHGIVDFKKEGRIKEVFLTDRGLDIAHDLEGLVRGLEQLGAD
ncbi:MAG: hypothetical protein V1921_09140 [Candidatus Altiarchaeota archaeon]